MIAIFYLALQILKLYSYVVIANVIISWLVAFNVLNTQNRFVYSILEFTYKLTDPILNRIRSCLLYTSPSPRDKRQSRMPSSA